MGKSFLGLDYGGTLSFTMIRMGRGGTNLVTSFPEMTTDSSEYSKSGDLIGESVNVKTAKNTCISTFFQIALDTWVRGQRLAR